MENKNIYRYIYQRYVSGIDCFLNETITVIDYILIQDGVKNKFYYNIVIEYHDDKITIHTEEINYLTFQRYLLMLESLSDSKRNIQIFSKTNVFENIRYLNLDDPKAGQIFEKVVEKNV